MAKHFVSLDAVRGIAALSVAVPHYFLFTGTHSTSLEFIAALAVEVFFVLSGVVLAPQLIHCVHTRSTRDVWTFYMRRWMRTLPPYLFVLVAMAVESRNLWSVDFTLYSFFLRNLFAVKNSNDFFVVAWSLAVEEWFYLVFPCFLLIITRWVSPTRAALVFMAVFLVLKILALFAAPHMYETARRIVVLRVDAICLGFLLSITLLPQVHKLSAALIGFIGAASLAAAILGWLKTDILAFAYGSALFAACLILEFARAERLFQNRSVDAVASFGAKTSYMVYLSHTLVVLIFGQLSGSLGTIGLPLYLVAVYAFCWAFYRYIEAPILSNRPSYLARVPA